MARGLSRGRIQLESDGSVETRRRPAATPIGGSRRDAALPVGAHWRVLAEQRTPCSGRG